MLNYINKNINKEKEKSKPFRLNSIFVILFIFLINILIFYQIVLRDKNIANSGSNLKTISGIFKERIMYTNGEYNKIWSIFKRIKDTIDIIQRWIMWNL